MPKKKRRGRNIRIINGDRRKKREQEIIWNIDAPTDFYKTLRNKKKERRTNVDVKTILTQLASMNSEREISGLASIAFGNKGELYLIVAGEPFRDPIRALGAIERIKTLLDYHPEHPVIKQ